jgi:hypothetical protein
MKLTGTIPCPVRDAHRRMQGAAVDDMEHHPATEWRQDVSLEIWIRTEMSRVELGLSGTLGHAAAAQLDHLMGDLLKEGWREFEIVLAGLRLDGEDGADGLASVERLVARHGGHVTWTGVAISIPAPVSTDTSAGGSEPEALSAGFGDLLATL